MNLTSRRPWVRAQEEYTQALAALPELRERRRVAKARVREMRKTDTVSLKDWWAAVDEMKGTFNALKDANTLVRQKLATWKAMIGAPKQGRDRSGRNIPQVETVARRQDKINVQARKSQRWADFRAKEHAAKFPHANLQSAVMVLAQEAFQDRFFNVKVAQDVVTVQGARATHDLPRGGTTVQENYLHAISHLTRLCYLPQGCATIREAECWEGVGWVVEVRPDQDPQAYFYMVTPRYEKARKEYQRITGQIADSDPEYLPETAKLITPKA